MTTHIRSIAAGGAIAVAAFFAIVPAFASADTPTCGWWWGITDQACGTGTVLTYVQVINRDNTSYVPGNFIVTAQGQNPSLPTFPGSLQGTLEVFTAGAQYSMTLQNPLNLAVQYSTGCSGTVNKNTQALCVITVSAGPAYSATPTPYPYPYAQQPLTCNPQYQSVAAGQTATFIALGGVGAYNWSTLEHTNLQTGPVYNTTFGVRGSQTVSVTSGTQTATCTVDVGGSGPIVYGGSSSIATYPVTSLTYTTQPSSLPNTGFEPLSSSQLAAIAAILIAIVLALYPYVRTLVAIAIA